MHKYTVGGGGATNFATIAAASGGTVTLNGATVEVPAGAMASNIQVTVDKVKNTSILPVYGDGKVKPKVNTTRAEAVTVILRALHAKP